MMEWEKNGMMEWGKDRGLLYPARHLRQVSWKLCRGSQGSIPDMLTKSA